MIEDNIKNLIKILEESTIDEMEVSTFWGKQRIRIRKTLSPQPVDNVEIMQDSSQNATTEIVKQKHNIETNNKSESIEPEEESKEISLKQNEDTIYIKAPLVGTFYSSPKPGELPFISEGDIIKEGQVICIIEAMKIFNEIKAQCSGTVTKVLVANGEPIEFGQPLFVVKPQ